MILERTAVAKMLTTATKQ